MYPFKRGERVKVELVSQKEGNVIECTASVVGVATNNEIPFLGYGFIILVDPAQGWEDITGFGSDYTIAYSRYMERL
ncbi:hypothetical protein phiAS5_ORF0254 [Aeromonas phage phiAS5]|uniref:Uncharacterized protein n=1 Tax=Aeromonas phage phiAS5 TaxID=879630 RepID=E1A208_9CAUD|nr:hypothetical protein phiAS5_ORF0254 [Aeromonas phage phiAS5]ADM80097.1 hypothetical protein phiAS5_ORF0254 [Aeromonas phage phiAS5]